MSGSFSWHIYFFVWGLLYYIVYIVVLNIIYGLNAEEKQQNKRK